MKKETLQQAIKIQESIDELSNHKAAVKSFMIQKERSSTYPEFRLSCPTFKEYTVLDAAFFGDFNDGPEELLERYVTQIDRKIQQLEERIAAL